MNTKTILVLNTRAQRYLRF